MNLFGDASRVLLAYLLLSVALGLCLGLGAYTFVYARGASYLSNDPMACTNCHVMRESFDGWVKSSHHAVAKCNDCHLPHGLLAKYSAKASNGFWHSLAFTTGDFPDPIRIKARNRRITEASCRACHREATLAMDGPHQGGSLSCLSCHASVGHPR